MERGNVLQLTVAAFFAAALFAVNYAIGAALTIATGTPGASGLITGIFTATIMYLACYVLGTGWRAGALVFGLYCVFAWPTVLMGPPGWHKIPTGLLAGVLFGAILNFRLDSDSLQLNSSWLRTIFAWFSFTAGIVLGTALFFSLLDLPGKDRFFAAIWIFAGVFFSLGLIGLYIARILAPKLNNTETFKQLRTKL